MHYRHTMFVIATTCAIASAHGETLSADKSATFGFGPYASEISLTTDRSSTAATESAFVLDLTGSTGDGVIPAATQPDLAWDSGIGEALARAGWGSVNDVDTGLSWRALADTLFSHPDLAGTSASAHGLTAGLGSSPAGGPSTGPSAGQDRNTYRVGFDASRTGQGVGRAPARNFDLRIVPVPGAAAMGAIVIGGGLLGSRTRRR